MNVFELAQQGMGAGWDEAGRMNGGMGVEQDKEDGLRSLMVMDSINDAGVFTQLLRDAVIDKRTGKLQDGVTMRDLKDVIMAHNDLVALEIRHREALSLNNDISLLLQAVVDSFDEAAPELRDKFLTRLDWHLNRKLEMRGIN